MEQNLINQQSVEERFENDLQKITALIGHLEEISKREKYIQRDLEDQIAEELEIIKNTNMAAEQKPAPNIPTVVVEDVIDLLDSGYTRYKKDDKGQGSVQEHYNLSFSQVKELFANDRLKGLKTKSPKIIIVERGAVTAAPTPAVAAPKVDDTFA